MFRKKWKIFKWSVPIWVVVACLVLGVVGGIAAFSALLSASVDITAQDLDASFENLACVLQGDGEGSVDTCTMSAGIATIEVTGVTNNTVVHLDLIARNDDLIVTYNLGFTPPGTLPDGVSAITCDSEGTDCDIAVLLPDSGGRAIDVDIELGTLVASQVIDNFSLAFELAE